MSLKIRDGFSLATYLTGAAALAGANAHGAVVYQSFNQLLSDPSTSATTPDINSVLAAIHFDGTSITLDHATTGDSLSITSDETTTVGSDKVTTEGVVQATGGYSQTAAFINAGDLIASSFTAATGSITLTGTGTDTLIGVKTTAGNLGWVRFSYTTGAGTVTVRDAAFESTPGQSIAAAAVPEASAAALLGLAGGAAALRRRRR